MKTRLLSLAVLGCALCSAQDAPAPAAAPENKPDAKRSASSASSSIQAGSGKIVMETEVNGKKETRVIDLNDPATAASMQGKVVITTDIDGKKETRIVDLKDAGNIMAPFLFEERPPVRTGMITYLGVAAIELPREVSAQVPLPLETGLLIGAIAPGSPAAAAGLKESDVLSKFDDQILITPRQLAVLIANHKEGDTVKLTYYRKGQPAATDAVLGKHEAPAPVAASNPLARITRHLLKVGPDGKIIQDPATPGSPFGTSKGIEMSSAELQKFLDQCPAQIRADIEKAIRSAKPLALPVPLAPENAELPAEKPAAPK
ncbi:MAG TPA: PDZ domain-containing protein [Verrucomicrobiales bacterium]|nr:PDZ domain-containing protein [Verrucomicrobiales bacterium]